MLHPPAVRPVRRGVGAEGGARPDGRHPGTGIYYGLAWFSVLSVLLLFVGLSNSILPCGTRGFLGMAYAPALFAAIGVQKNTRDALRTGGDVETGGFWRSRSEQAPKPEPHSAP